MVLETAQFHVSHSLRKTLRAVARDPERQLELDADFGSVMQACAEPRPGQDGTWIVPELMAAYCDLAQAGHAVAMSLKDAQGQLLGAAYGVSIGRMFYGESMVSRVRDGSKIALAALVALLRREQVPVIDCQQKTGHLASLGARTVPRAGFCERVAQLADLPQLDWAPYRGRRLNFLLETY
jgi:leucyl/phenylalanyl-tRNA--protein transferase